MTTFLAIVEVRFRSEVRLEADDIEGVWDAIEDMSMGELENYPMTAAVVDVIRCDPVFTVEEAKR